MHLTLDLEMDLGELGTRTVTFGVEFHPPGPDGDELSPGEITVETSTVVTKSNTRFNLQPLLPLVVDLSLLKADLFEKACAQEGF
jgi:hypothetical protein